VTAWTLSGFGDEIDPDPQVQADLLLELGAKHIEVRSAWGVNVVDLDDELLQQLATVLRDRGLAVSAVASPIGKVPVALAAELELDRLRRVIRVAHVLESRYIRIFSFYPADGQEKSDARDDVLARMALLAREAESAGLTLVHENEKGIYGDTPERVLDIVESVGSANLRVAWDSANFVQVGVRPFTEGYAMLRPHLEYLQVKDALAATGTVVPAGEGDGELLETLTALRDDGYEGFASLEPHLASAYELGGFSGPVAFEKAATAFSTLTARIGVDLV
jgi:sugar phosphate isomerase/epimerase